MHLHPSQTPCSRFAAACIDAGRRWARVAGVMSLCHIVWYQNDTTDLRISTIMPLTHLSVCWSPETVSAGVAAGPSVVTSSWQIAWEGKSGGAEWEMNTHDGTGGRSSGARRRWTPVMFLYCCLNQLDHVCPSKRAEDPWSTVHHQRAAAVSDNTKRSNNTCLH